MIGLVSVSPCACICVCVRGDGCDSESVLWWLFAYLSACVCDRERDRGSEHTSSVCERVRERERRRERESHCTSVLLPVALPSSLLLPLLSLLLLLFGFSSSHRALLASLLVPSWQDHSCRQLPVASSQLTHARTHSHFHFVFVASAPSAAAAPPAAVPCLLPAPLSFWRSRKRKCCGRRRRCFCSGFMTFFCQRTPCHLTHTHTYTRMQQALLLNHREATPFPCAQRVRSSVCI